MFGTSNLMLTSAPNSIRMLTSAYIKCLHVPKLMTNAEVNLFRTLCAEVNSLDDQRI